MNATAADSRIPELLAPAGDDEALRAAVANGADAVYFGLSDFNALHSRRRDHDAVLFAFDLIEHQGDDLRNAPLRDRKRQLAKLLGRAKDGIQFNEHLAHDGPAVFEHACRMGLEGIVSKRIDAPYRSGRSKTWLKSKNPLSEAVRRESEEEDWGR